ncbi:MAG: phage Gp37/Gp68 family protein [Candidatus Brocadiia bacterium]|jgi:protein gp37
MSGKTKIEWTEAAWNPITGCSPVSEGCEHCYAQRMAQRLAGRYGYPKAYPFAVTVHDDRMVEPLSWKKPRRIFVCSMADLMHDNVPDMAIRDVIGTIKAAPQHTFQILTKRPRRLEEWVWPSNVWLGVTAENQQRADERIPILLTHQHASVLFVSIEPMLGPITLKRYIGDPMPRPWPVLVHADGGTPPRGLDWVICGAETGPGARPMHNVWADDLYRQCKKASVPFFFKKQTEGLGVLEKVLACREIPGVESQ